MFSNPRSLFVNRNNPFAPRPNLPSSTPTQTSSTPSQPSQTQPNENELRATAQSHIQRYTTNFRTIYSTTQINHAIVDSTASQDEYIEDLHDNYIDKNTDLENKIRTMRHEKLMNDRKTFYKTSAYSKLNVFYWIFFFVYYATCVILIIDISLNSFTIHKLIIIIAFVIYPISVEYVTHLLYLFYLEMLTRFPKHVYNTI